MAASAQPPGRKPDPRRSAAAKKAAATRRKNKANQSQQAATGTSGTGTTSQSGGSNAGGNASNGTTRVRIPDRVTSLLAMRPGRNWLPVAGVIIAVVAVAIVAITSIGGGDNGDSRHASLTPAPLAAEEEQEEAPESGISDESGLSTYEEVENRFENMGRQDYLKLAKRDGRCAREGDFIHAKVLGDNPSPKRKLEVTLLCMAKDPVTRVGLTQTFNKGAFNSRELGRMLTAGPNHDLNWEAWRGFRDRVTGAGHISTVNLGGSGFTTFVTQDGTVGSTHDPNLDERGTRFKMAAATVNGKHMPAKNIVTEETCTNRVLPQKTVFVPPAAPPKGGPGPGPGPSPEGRHPAQPGGDNLGGGRPQQQGGSYGDTHRRVPNTPATPKRRPVIQPDTPVRTPSGTGGEIKPNDPPPQSDSGGGTVTQPTAPPTPQPSEPPNTGPSATPPPPPESGAPPPPPAEQGAPPPPSSTSTSAAPPPPPPPLE